MNAIRKPLVATVTNFSTHKPHPHPTETALATLIPDCYHAMHSTRLLLATTPGDAHALLEEYLSS